MLNKPIVRASAAIALGAIVGALSRYYVSLGIAQRLGSQWPYSTLVVNVTGCFAMGFLAVLASQSVLRTYPEVRLLLLTGFLGSYTTFSTYALDASRLFARDALMSALLYWVGSPILGLLALQLGAALAERWLAHLESRRSL